VEKEGGSVIHPTSEVPSNFSAAVAPMETKYFISVRLSVCVCVCVCPRAYLRNYLSSLCRILCALITITYGRGSVLLSRCCDVLV